MLQLIISQSHLPFAGRLLDPHNNPVAIAVKDQFEHLQQVSVHNGRLSAVLGNSGQEVRYKLCPAFTGKDYNALLQKQKLLVICELQPMACINLTDHDIE